MTHPKRPRDPSQLAKLMIDIASGEVSDRAPTPEEQGKDPAAVALGRRGGLKGGAARATALTAEANPHADWEKKIAPRVRDRIIEDLKAVDPKLLPQGGNKLGGIKHYQSLAASAQQYGVAIGKLNGLVNPGHTGAINDARQDFAELTKEIIKRTGI